MLRSIQGTWALVLGASSGIGEAIAVGLAREGVNVVGVHFDSGARAEKVALLVDELRDHGVRAHFFNVNAAAERTRAEMVDRLAELTGGSGLQILVHSLAFGSLVPFLPGDGRPKALDKRQMAMTLDVMAHSLVYWVQDLVAADLLPPGAKVYAMTSSGTTQMLPSYGAVSAAKAALESHVRQLALELAPRRVAVNALRAGTTLTPALERIPEHAQFVDEATLSNPHGRLTTPQDVAEAVVLLSRTDSSWITANTIGIDGGELYAPGTVWGARRATGSPDDSEEGTR